MLTVGGRTWRLWGLVVPKAGTACVGDWNAARAARKHLDQLISGRLVGCEYRGKGADEVAFAVCRADGKDIGADLVRAGLAWSYGNQSRDYVVDEGFAMSGVRGVHARGCRLPEVLLTRPPIGYNPN